jgi:hypothetical protein
MAIPSTNQLATIRSQGGFEYRLTRDDVLWMARMAVYEGGNADDSLWTVTQRFVWFAEARGTSFESLAALAQAFSQPINPKWRASGEFCAPGGKYVGTDYCSDSRLARREAHATATLQGMTAEDPEAVNLALLWAEGRLPNPVPGGTNFANAKVATGYLDRHPEAELLVKRGNWHIVEREALKWPQNYVSMEAADGAVANASGVRQPTPVAAFGRGVLQAMTDWWRLG